MVEIKKLKFTSAQTKAREKRKLNNMLHDLRVIKAELLPNDEKIKNPTDPSTLDDFQRKKHQLNSLLLTIRTQVDLLQKQTEKNDGVRSVETIQLQSDISSQIEKGVAQFTDLKEQLKHDSQKRILGAKLTEEQIADRAQIVKLLGEELSDLTKHARVSNQGGGMLDTDETRSMQERVSRERARLDDLRAKRAEARRKRRKGSKEDDFDGVSDQPQSEAEQVFEQKVAENVVEQDAMLTEISAGLDELKELGLDMNKSLKVQEAMLEQVDTKMDKVINQYKTANQRMKHILEETGGLVRWIPIIFCLVVLVVLIGVIFHIV